MKVKNLPSVIKKRAKIYIKENFPDKKTRPSKLINSFDWGDTIEGSRYWEFVNEGRFLDAENHLREKNGDDISEELYEFTKPFFLDEVLSTINVNEPEVVDPIVEAVREKLKQRSAVGIKKYGTTLAENNTDDFLNHLQEELMDSILYIEKLKNK